ncbi:hypothetical protein ACLB2K_063711 [Fragaria x ananassa]
MDLGHLLHLLIPSTTSVAIVFCLLDRCRIYTSRQTCPRRRLARRVSSPLSLQWSDIASDSGRDSRGCFQVGYRIAYFIK